MELFRFFFFFLSLLVQSFRSKGGQQDVLERETLSDP